ncbi:putative cation-transporting ATPase 13A4, partial [Dissostichus eleginoides]
ETSDGRLVGDKGPPFDPKTLSPEMVARGPGNHTRGAPLSAQPNLPCDTINRAPLSGPSSSQHRVHGDSEVRHFEVRMLLS